MKKIWPFPVTFNNIGKNPCRHILSVLLIFNISAGDLYAQQVSQWFEQQYVYKIWDNQKGLPQNSVFDIARDKDGYLWVATEEGLLRFDGNTFRLINDENTPGLHSNAFYDLLASPGKGVWAVSRNTLLLVNSTVIKTVDFSNHTKSAWLSSIAEDKGGMLWIGTSGGRLFQVSDYSINEIMDSAFHNRSIQVMLAVEDGIMIGTNTGLFKYNNHTKKITGIPGFESINIRSLVMDSSKSLWIGTKENGLFHKTDSSTVNYTLKDGLSDMFITSIAVDHFGNTLIGTSTSGLQKFSRGRFTNFEKKTFSNDGIRCIYISENELTWLGTSASGLIQMKPAQVQMLSEKFPLTSKIILPVYEHKNGDVWIGTAGNGINRIVNGKTVHYSKENGIGSNIILSIYGTDNEIYVGTSKGMDVFDLAKNKFIRHYTVKDGLTDNIIQAVFVDSQKQVWIATRAGGLYRLLKDGNLQRMSLPDAFTKTDFTSFFEDRMHNTWVGTTGLGMIRINTKNVITHYTLEEGLTAERIETFYEDPEGDLWLGTEKGIVSFKNGKFTLFNKTNGLEFNVIYSIIDDNEGNVWLSGNFGIQRIAVAELEKIKRSKNKGIKIPVKLFNVSDGMANAETNGGIFPAGWRMKDGSLWFPTVAGVAIVQSSLLNDNRTPMNIHIQSIKYADEERAGLNDIKIPAGVYNIQIGYTSIDFNTSHTLKYHYRLKGLDKEWVFADNRMVAYFTSLDPGNYVFEVKAEQYGKFSETAELPFIIKPFFYQTIFFKVSVLLLLFIAGFLVKQVHTKYQQKRRLLETVVTHSNDGLREIAWTQSHVVRAPLARMMGLINIIEEYDHSNFDIKDVLKDIKKSGAELDQIIREIVKKTETIKKNMENEV